MLGYWQYAAGALVLGLAGVFVYGVYDWWRVTGQTSDFASIAEIDFRMPKPDPMAQMGLAPMDDLSDASRKANLEEGARRFGAAAKEASGAAAVYGWLKSAEAWQRAGNVAEQEKALAAANAVGDNDMPGFAAASAYATALLDAGKKDEALALRQSMTTRFSRGFLAERALLDLAAAQADAGQTDAAKTSLTQFFGSFPNSSLGAAARSLSLRVGLPIPSAPPAAGAAPTPAASAPAAPAPAGSGG